MKVNTDPKKIKEVLTRNVVEVIPSKRALATLLKERRIRLYLGIDPTSPELHLGHAVALRKLREFQELGHRVIFLIGDFTAQIGDPSGRDKKREPLSFSQIKKNMAPYKKQAGKILDLSKVEIKYNSEWLSQLSLKDFLGISSRITISRLLERDMFQQRFQKGEEVWLNELLYPLLQGYDSVAMNVDLEVGATDQTFNMLVGRKLQRIYNKKEKFVLTTPMLAGLDGRKMSKSYGNTINILDPPREMYGKIMSIKDELIPQYFELCTNLPLKEIAAIKKKLKNQKVNPRDLKARLAQEIVKLYYGEGKAKKAGQEFKRIFQEKKLPSQIKEVEIREKKIAILDLLVKAKLASSKSEAKRLVFQRGVKINGRTLQNWQDLIEIKKGQILQVGKRKFVKIG
jgi:tyrosyl-tRNA synthetase